MTEVVVGGKKINLHPDHKAWFAERGYSNSEINAIVKDRFNTTLIQCVKDVCALHKEQFRKAVGIWEDITRLDLELEDKHNRMNSLYEKLESKYHVIRPRNVCWASIRSSNLTRLIDDGKTYAEAKTVIWVPTEDEDEFERCYNELLGLSARTQALATEMISKRKAVEKYCESIRKSVWRVKKVPANQIYNPCPGEIVVRNRLRINHEEHFNVYCRNGFDEVYSVDSYDETRFKATIVPDNRSPNNMILRTTPCAKANIIAKFVSENDTDGLIAYLNSIDGINVDN